MENIIDLENSLYNTDNSSFSSIKDFRVLSVLGSGSCGIVYKAYSARDESRQLFAIKQVKMQNALSTEKQAKCL